jgi:hypothetical protein
MKRPKDDFSEERKKKKKPFCRLGRSQNEFCARMHIDGQKEHI